MSGMASKPCCARFAILSATGRRVLDAAASTVPVPCESPAKTVWRFGFEALGFWIRHAWPRHSTEGFGLRGGACR